MKRWFTENEWDEIIASVPLLSLPRLDVALADSLKRFFPMRCRAMLQEVLDKQGYFPEGVGYDRVAGLYISRNFSYDNIPFLSTSLILLEAPGDLETLAATLAERRKKTRYSLPMTQTSCCEEVVFPPKYSLRVLNLNVQLALLCEAPCKCYFFPGISH